MIMSVPMLLRGTVVQVSQPLAAITSVIRVLMAITKPATFTAVLYLRLLISLRAYVRGFKWSTSLVSQKRIIQEQKQPQNNASTSQAPTIPLVSD
jgi:hypothetical protein